MTLDLRSKKKKMELIGWNSEDQVWKQVGIKTILKDKKAGNKAIVFSRSSLFQTLLLKFIIMVATAREFWLCPCICLTSSTFQVLSCRIWLVGFKSHAYILIAMGQRIVSDSSTFDVRKKCKDYTYWEVP